MGYIRVSFGARVILLVLRYSNEFEMAHGVCLRHRLEYKTDGAKSDLFKFGVLVDVGHLGQQ